MAQRADDPREWTQDGRRRKGLQRRRLLVEATMRVIGRDGVAAVSQRVVAAEARVAPSAVTYYFPTIDELLVAALTACNDAYLHRLASFQDHGVDALRQLGNLIAASADDSRTHAVAEYELYLLAGRRADMRTELARWTRALDEFLKPFVDDPVTRAGVTAAVDGLFLRTFCADDPPGADEIYEILVRLTRT